MTAVLELSKRLLRSPPDPASASTHADAEDAAALEAYMARTIDFRLEQVLGAVIGLFYSSELFSASPKARSDCVAHLGADVSEAQLDCFVAFGQHLLCNGLQGCWGREIDNMEHEMENQWWDFCSIRSIDVDDTLPTKYPVLPPEDEALLFCYSFRAPRPEHTKQHDDPITRGSLMEKKQKNMMEKKQKNSSAVVDVQGASSSKHASVPKFFELAQRILHSRFFLRFPLENLGHNYRRFCKRSGRTGVWEQAYSELAHKEVVIREKKFRGVPESCSPLTRSQLMRLVEKLGSHGKGTLLRALLIARPPLSMLPHLHTVIDCTTHARLWLMGIDQRIYMESRLTYAALGSGSSVEEEREVYRSIYLQERVPSVVELQQRQHCHASLCSLAGWRDTEVLVLSGPDYDALGAPDDEMWRAVREHIDSAMLYSEGEEVDPACVFQEIFCYYRPLLDVDRKWQRLHPSLGRSHMHRPTPGASRSPVVFHRE